MPEINLLPCPFCGSAAHMCGRKSTEYFEGKFASKEHEEYWITCFHSINCVLGSITARAFGIVGGITYTTQEAAASAWNRRAEK